MRVAIKASNILGLPREATVEHNGSELTFNVDIFEKMSYSGEYDVFEHINQFWSYLSPEQQSVIFDIYREARLTFDSALPLDKLTHQLYNLTTLLMGQHDLSQIHHWIGFYSRIIISPDLQDTYNDDGALPGSRERTYLRDDYQQLLALTIATRAMIPIWGEYISHSRRIVGTNFKEYYALRLLSRSAIVESPAFVKLGRYVELSIPVDKSKAPAVLGGLSTDDFPTWMLSQVMIRRLAVGDLRGLDSKTSLITFIYKFIVQKTKSHESAFEGNVKDKPVSDGQSGDSETNLSKLEGYKAKRELSAGDIQVLVVYMNKPVHIAKMLVPDIDPELVMRCIESTKVLENNRIWDPQVILTQWVLARAFPARGIWYLSKPLVAKAIGIALAILWHKNHHHLAAFVSSIEQPDIDEMYSSSDSRARIPKEILESLDTLYPYSKKVPGKQRLLKRINPAVESIDKVSEGLSERNWTTTLPDDMLEAVTGNSRSRRLIVPYDIKIKLANLVLDLRGQS